MIFKTGKQTPTPDQRRIVRTTADDTFCRELPGDFGDLPCGDEYSHEWGTAVALRLKAVNPHWDPWLGDSREPAKRCALFWLISGADVWLQVGGGAVRMQPGDYVAFDDAVMHCVVADRVWRGVACQMAQIETRVKND